MRGLKELRVKIFFVCCRQQLIRVYLTFQLEDKKGHRNPGREVFTQTNKNLMLIREKAEV